MRRGLTAPESDERMDAIETLLCPADRDGIARAAALLRLGEIIALPTETVYGHCSRRPQRQRGGKDLQGQGPPPG